MESTQLTSLTKSELEEFVIRYKQPKFRADQLFKGIHGRRLREFSDFSDLPKDFRDLLSDTATLSSLRVESRFISADGTRRFLMKTSDGYPVETVFIPSVISLSSTSILLSLSLSSASLFLCLLFRSLSLFFLTLVLFALCLALSLSLALSVLDLSMLFLYI